jgi:cytochrome b
MPPDTQPTSPSASANEATRIAIAVWDMPTRAFHWTLAVLVAVSWITGTKGWMEWHLLSGYGVLALVLFRLLWGVLGSESARFASFLRGPRAAFAHFGELLRRCPDHHTTHNPLGGYAVALMLIVLAVQTATGLFADDEILTTGPLSSFAPGRMVRLATWVHVLNSNLILVVVLLHLAAIAAYALVFRRSLVSAMLTGTKFLPAGTPAPRMRSIWLALGLFLLCAAAVQGIASLGG